MQEPIYLGSMIGRKSTDFGLVDVRPLKELLLPLQNGNAAGNSD